MKLEKTFKKVYKRIIDESFLKRWLMNILKILFNIKTIAWLGGPLLE